jgi:hypothetical protein
MDSFEFFFSFYGLLLGLSVATVVVGLAGMVALRRRVKLSPLPVLLGIFLLQDIATLWVFAWETRESLTVSYANIYGAMIIAALYFMAASLAFPIGLTEDGDPESHYWDNKRLVFGAVIAGSMLTLVHAVSVDAIGITSLPSAVLQLIYWAPLVALLFSKWRRLDVALLAILVVGYLADPVLELV